MGETSVTVTVPGGVMRQSIIIKLRIKTGLLRLVVSRSMSESVAH